MQRENRLEILWESDGRMVTMMTIGGASTERAVFSDDNAILVVHASGGSFSYLVDLNGRNLIGKLKHINFHLPSGYAQVDKNRLYTLDYETFEVWTKVNQE